VPTVTELADFDLTHVPEGSLFKANGCAECSEKGYSGRTGIYELLVVSDEVRAMVVAGKATGTIRRKAVEQGLKTLRDDGIRKALEGLTSLEEVRRVTQEDDAAVE
jgi:type II secretory ATPase GspE/PulE/Tfp pilus assembly ATPase PilB-like protein